MICSTRIAAGPHSWLLLGLEGGVQHLGRIEGFYSVASNSGKICNGVLLRKYSANGERRAPSLYVVTETPTWSFWPLELLPSLVRQRICCGICLTTSLQHAYIVSVVPDFHADAKTDPPSMLLNLLLRPKYRLRYKSSA